jgi:hypothetical protein
MVAELARMDTELKKFTIENRFQVDRVGSTISSQIKKLEVKNKNTEGTPSKISISRAYTSTIISTLVLKIDDIQKEHR